MIFIIDDDEIMCECIARACGVGVETRVFHNAIEAMAAMGGDGTNVANETNVSFEGNETNVAKLPELIFLDVLLDGPDGFTLLNEMVSYADTAQVPVVIVSSLNLAGMDLSAYGVVGFLNKDKMRPEEIGAYVQRYSARH